MAFLLVSKHVDHRLFTWRPFSSDIMLQVNRLLVFKVACSKNVGNLTDYYHFSTFWIDGAFFFFFFFLNVTLSENTGRVWCASYATIRHFTKWKWHEVKPYERQFLSARRTFPPCEMNDYLLWIWVHPLPYAFFTWPPNLYRGLSHV